MVISVDQQAQTPLYKQIANSVKVAISNEELKIGDTLPSINHLYDTIGVSKDTVKKAYAILLKEGLIEAAHGKGFFVCPATAGVYKILVLFDFISTYKKELYQSITKSLAGRAEFTIRVFNQDIDLFERFIEENVGLYDYYVVTPHLPLDHPTQQRAIKSLAKIPNRKLVVLDHIPSGMHGNFMSVYQDFENDIYDGLVQALPAIKKYTKLNVYTMPGSLYAPMLEKGLSRFCSDYSINHEVFKNAVPQKIEKTECFLILNGQLDNELIEIAKIARSQRLRIGKDIGILSYNESPVNEIILDGLSVLSTNFHQMGSAAAELILAKAPERRKNEFGFIQRNTL